MLTDERMMAEIRDANLSYLILAQSLIRKDPVQALYRLGISEETAELVDQLSPAQLLRVAQGNMLICRFRFDDQMLWSLLADHGAAEDQREDRSAPSSSRIRPRCSRRPSRQCRVRSKGRSTPRPATCS